MGDAHYLMGIGYDFQGKYDSAAYHHLIALQERRELNDETKKGKSYVNLGNLYWKLGLIREARDCQETAIAIWERLSNKSSEANAYRNLGLVEQEDKRYDQAEAAYRHSLHLYQRLGNQAQVANLYNDLGAVNELKLDSPNDSTANDSTVLAYYQQALRLSSTDDEQALGWLLGNIGRAYNRLHQPDSGLTFLLNSKTKLESLPLEKLESHTLVNVYNGIADSYIQKADFKKAIETLEKAEGLDKFVTGLFRKEFLDTYQLFQDIYTVQKNTAQVNHYQKKYQGIQSELANIKIVAENVQLRSQVRVKDLQNFLSWKRERALEGMDRFAKTILIPVSLLLFVLLIFIFWRQVKQDRRIRRYQILVMSLLPDFDFDERRAEEK
jgi:tetratricopeptide (TPR) repeat protein